MCEYMRINPNEKEQFPTCEINNELCTLCVMGNAKTYNEAKERERLNGSPKHV